MMRKFMIATGAALVLASQPVAAQDDGMTDETLAAMSQMFPAEPLTPEQEARLPMARQIVAKVMPDGIMGEMMSEMFNGFLGPLMAMGTDIDASTALSQLGLTGSEVELSDEEAVEIMAIIDPAYAERTQAEAEAMPKIMGAVSGAIEPTMRVAMAEMYAVYFTQSELGELDVFFSTPTGASYAQKSMKMSSDPRFIGAMMESMPAMMGTFATMEFEMKAVTAGFAERRAYGDLSAAERAKLSEITGVDQGTLENAMAAAGEEEMGQ